ncbi:MAG: hypothetical protein FWC43_01800 [Planctomycetaceae bacterium]|nr:hypothetical protein [Planctomycetaceae bacterium]
MQPFFEVEQEITPLFSAGSLVSEPVFALDTPVAGTFQSESFALFEAGEIVTKFDTAAEIDKIVYVPFKKGTTHADMEAMGLSVADNMKVFRSTTATETFFADVVSEEDFDLAWAVTPQTDRAHDLLFADYEL